MSSAFWSHWIWPLITSILGFVFMVLLILQYLQRRKPHQLAWTVGFFLYAASALMEFYSEFTQNWDPNMYRIYYVMAAILVAFLGLGTVYLVFKKRIWGHVFLGYILIVLAFFLFFALTVPLNDPAANLAPGITVGGKAMAGGVRAFSFFFTIPGTIALLGGSIYSIVIFYTKKEYSYRVRANVLIIIGTLVIAGAGGMARTGRSVGLYPAEMIGAALLLWGFLTAGTLQKGAKARAAFLSQLQPDGGSRLFDADDVDPRPSNTER